MILEWKIDTGNNSKNNGKNNERNRYCNDCAICSRGDRIHTEPVMNELSNMINQEQTHKNKQILIETIYSSGLNIIPEG